MQARERPGEPSWARRLDRRRSALLIAAAFGVWAGFELFTAEPTTMAFAIDVLGLAIVAVSALLVFWMRRDLGGAVAGLALLALVVLLLADALTTRLGVACVLAALAGAVSVLVPREDLQP